jgi:cobalt-zinc-cadmium efflux system protein
MTSHQHEGHAHVATDDADAKRLRRGLMLIVGFMVAEIVAGILADSLALLSDAAHMLTDAGALLLSIVVIRLVRRPAGGTSPSACVGSRPFRPRRTARSYSSWRA